MRLLRWVGAALFLCLALPGCKQGVGDRCQVLSDCQDGLVCNLPNNGTPQTGGTCQEPGGFDAGTVDSSTHADASETDAAADAAVNVDAAEGDL